MSTTTNFFEALKNHKPAPRAKIFFRLYYDVQTGKPIEYSMEDRPGEYINVTAEQFAIADLNIIVKDGEIRKRRLLNYGKMKPSKEGYSVCPTDITLVDPDSDTYWAFSTYEDDYV